MAKGRKTAGSGEHAEQHEEKGLKLGKKQDLWIALGLFALALVIRLKFLNAGLWYTDAVIAAQSAEATYNTGVLHYMHGVGYPGNVIIITVLYAIAKLVFGAASAEYATLFSSFFFASLTVGLLYLLVKKMGGSTFAALSAALVLNILPVYLSTSTFGMSHQPAGFFIVLSFYLAMLASESKDVRLKVLSSASIGFATAIRLESLQMLPLTLLFYWKDNPPISVSIKEGYLKFKSRQDKNEILADLLYLIAPMAVMILLPYAPMLRDQGVKPLVDAFEYNRWLGFWVEGLTPLVIEWVTLSLTSIGWILIFAGLIYLLLRKDRRLFLIMLVWCAYFLVLANTLTVEDRHSIPALIGFTVAIGFGLDLIYSRIHKIAGLAVLLLLLGMMFNSIYPTLDYRSGFCGPKYFAMNLRDMVEKNSVVIVMDEAPHLQYYGGLKTIGHPLDGDPVKINESMREIAGYLANGTSVYMVSTALVYDTPLGISFDSSSGRLYDSDSMRVFSNLVYSPSSKSITDTTSGVSTGLYGRWQVQLFSDFMVMPVKSIDNEDWHKKSVMSGRFQETVFKVFSRA